MKNLFDGDPWPDFPDANKVPKNFKILKNPDGDLVLQAFGRDGSQHAVMTPIIAGCGVMGAVMVLQGILDKLPAKVD